MNELVVVRRGGLRMRRAITAKLPSTVNTLAALSRALTHSSNIEVEADIEEDHELPDSLLMSPIVDLFADDLVSGRKLLFCTFRGLSEYCHMGHSPL